MNNRRHSDRIPMKVQVKLAHASFGERMAYTRDISDSGLFLLVEVKGLPDIGTIIDGQVIGMSETPPVVPLEIIRYEKEGFGAKFVDTPS